MHSLALPAPPDLPTLSHSNPPPFHTLRTDGWRHLEVFVAGRAHNMPWEQLGRKLLEVFLEFIFVGYGVGWFPVVMHQIFYPGGNPWFYTDRY